MPVTPSRIAKALPLVGKTRAWFLPSAGAPHYGRTPLRES